MTETLFHPDNDGINWMGSRKCMSLKRLPNVVIGALVLRTTGSKSVVETDQKQYNK